MATAPKPESMTSEQEFRLRVPGISELNVMTRSFLEHVLEFADFKGEQARELRDSAYETIAIIEKQVEDEGDVAIPIDLRVVVDSIWFRLEILEHGRLLTDSFVSESAFDESQWIQLGKKGSQLRLSNKRPHSEISTLLHVKERLKGIGVHEAEIHAEQSDPTKYRIREFKDSDAPAISQRIFEAYGRTYANEDMYYPARIVAANQIGELLSVVTETMDGEIVGHCALEMPSPYPIAELGIAAVDHAHRGHGLLNRMNEYLLEVARRLNLDAQWAQPVTSHPYSQRMNLSYGWQPCGISFGAAPSNITFRGVADTGESGRLALLLHMFPLLPRDPLVAHVPETHAALVDAIYEAQNQEASLDTSLHPPTTETNGLESELGVSSKFNRSMRIGAIEVHTINHETLALVRQAEVFLREISGAEVIYIDLPITHRSCAWLADALRSDGFVFCGVGPRFLGEDSLRLQKLIAPYQHEGLDIEGELAQRIVDEVLQALRA